MIARALAGAAVTCALGAALAIEHGRARASELASDLGPALLAYAGATHDEGHRTLLVNGATLQMRTGVTDDAVDTVLERQRRACGPMHVLLPVLRWRTSSEGLLGCAVVTEGASLFEQLQALGELRVTWVLARGDVRRYVVISTQGALALAQMFPERGDAPGFDARELPRPPKARRILSAVQQGAEPMLVAYRSELALDAVERAYRAVLEGHGRIVETVQLRDQPALRVHGKTSAYLVLLGPDGEGTLTVILPLPAQPPR